MFRNDFSDSDFRSCYVHFYLTFCFSLPIGEYTDGTDESYLEREGSISRGSKPPSDRPPAYGAKTTSAKGGSGGLIIEETVTEKTSHLESSALDGGYEARVGQGAVGYEQEEDGMSLRHLCSSFTVNVINIGSRIT